MFKIARSNVILWPVAINLPVDGGLASTYI